MDKKYNDIVDCSENFLPIYEMEMNNMRNTIHNETKNYLKLMDDYIQTYSDPTDATVKKRATKSLIRSGVLTQSGKQKQHIVTR